MPNTLHMLVGSIDVELQKLATGAASDQKLRTLPTCISEFSQKIEGVFELGKDMEIPLPMEHRKFCIGICSL